MIAGARVFTFGADGMLHGLAFATGEKLWSVVNTNIWIVDALSPLPNTAVPARRIGCNARRSSGRGVIGGNRHRCFAKRLLPHRLPVTIGWIAGSIASYLTATGRVCLYNSFNW